MLALTFLITYFLSFDAMVVAFVPGLIAFLGSALGLTICMFVPPGDKKDEIK